MKKNNNIVKLVVAVLLAMISWWLGNKTASTEEIIQQVINVSDSVIVHDTINLRDTVFRNKYIKGKNTVKTVIKEVNKYVPDNTERIYTHIDKCVMINITYSDSGIRKVEILNPQNICEE